jgi:hypothetical protein
LHPSSKGLPLYPFFTLSDMLNLSSLVAVEAEVESSSAA